MRPCVLLLYLGSLVASCAQDLAPDTVTNTILTTTYTTSNLISGNLSVLHASNGLAYSVPFFEGPLGAGGAYKWTKTGPNTGILEYGSGTHTITLTFVFPSSGNSRDSTFGAGTFTLTTFPVSAHAPLSNVSTRATLAANQATSVGFVVSASTPHRVLVRAIGPSLAQFGVTNATANPVLSVYRGSTQVGTNSGWGGAPSLAAVFTAARAFALPTTSRDCAMVLTLAPGSYTALVRADTSGDVLVEVYFID